MKQTFMKSVMIDAGHGGKDPGAPGHDFKKPEKDINAEFAVILAKGLSAIFETIYFTRTGDNFMSLDDRCKRANSLKPDLFISIHCNSAESDKAEGCEVHSYKKGSKADEIATAIVNSICKDTTLVKNNRGAKESNFQVLKYTKMPAVLIELGFLSNKTDEKALNDNSILTQYALRIRDALKPFTGK